MTLTWPPTLPDLKVDARINDSRDDVKLGNELDAAIAYVEGARSGQVDFTGLLTAEELAAQGLLPTTPTLCLGTIRLALRWQARGRSPDAMIASQDGPTVRIGTGDADIDRMLRVGRYAMPVIA